MSLPKSPSGMIAYNRRITRLVYIFIAVIVVIALLAGFFGALTRHGGLRSDNRQLRPVMRRSMKAMPMDEVPGVNEKPDLFAALKMAEDNLKTRKPILETEERLTLAYEQLSFVLLLDGPVGEKEMKGVRGFIGGLHRQRNVTHHVPRVSLFTTRHLDTEYIEEISLWSKVTNYNLQSFLSLPQTDDVEGQLAVHGELIRYALLDAISKEDGNAIWVKRGWEFDPAHQSLKDAEKTEDPVLIKQAIAKGRKFLEALASNLATRGYIHVVDKNNQIVVEGYLWDHPSDQVLQTRLACLYGLPECKPFDPEIKKFSSEVFGLYPHNPKGDLVCNLDIKADPVLNFFLIKEVGSTTSSKAYKEAFSNPTIKKLFVALPTTSKGLKNSTEPVFFKALVPSMLDTLQEDELKKFVITVYIGYDHGDELFENEKQRTSMIQKLEEMIGDRPIQIQMLRLPKTGRVAMLWSMMYDRAIHEGAQYFYQVNDDLTMVTKGWLTKFTSTLDSNNGFGVVGPADYHNGLNCTILTQAMVTRVHYDIFTILYPIELKDWKTDRWLTHVYGPDDTFCWGDYVANNGASKTRYAHCPFLSWKIYLEAGKERIAKWKIDHKK